MNVDELKEELNQLKSDMAAHRKKGDDMFIAQLKIGNIPSKIKMFEATNTEKDYLVAKKLLADARKEVPELPKENFNNPANALLQQLKQNIAKAKQDIALGNKKEAVEIYQQIAAAYPTLTPDQKRELLPELKIILNSLK